MSNPRCLRAAIEACRPLKTRGTSFAQSSIRSRAYHISRPLSATPDITAGFPMPDPLQTSSRSTNSQPSASNIETEQRTSKPKTQPSQSSPTSTKSIPTTSPPQSQTLAPVKTTSTNVSSSKQSDDSPSIPPNVYAAYRTPLRHKAQHGIPVASLQLRSFSVRNLEFFADFAMRAAYYLNLPASGPVPLPKRIERWTVIRSNFVHKKSQENFERITMKRLITVYDGDPSVVEVWLAYLRRHQFYGVGMKANVWEWEGLDVAAKMDRQSAEAAADLDAKLANFGFNQTVAKDKDLAKIMQKRAGEHSGMPMSFVRDGSTTADQRV